MLPFFLLVCAISFLLPLLVTSVLHDVLNATAQHQTLITSFSLLILGISLSTLSTLNFSLGLLVGLFAAPLNFVLPVLPPTIPSPLAPKKGQTSSSTVETVSVLAVIALLLAAAPTTVIIISGWYLGGSGAPLIGLRNLLLEANFAWHVNGTWTSVIVWVIWWPAWILGLTVCCMRLTSRSNFISDQKTRVGEVLVENKS